MSLTVRIGMLVAFIASLSSCRKPIETSRLQTLENIGSRNFIFEACSGSNQIHRKASLGNEQHLKEALAAVPFSIQSQFFDDLGGLIRIGSAADCATSSSRVDDSLGCWRRLPDKNRSIEIVVVRRDKTKEQYALVRTFGFVYVDILINRVLPPSINEPVKISQGPGQGLSSYKTSLASTFLGELLQKTAISDRRGVIQTLSELGISESISEERDFQKRLSQFSKLSSPIREAFASRVFAEAFHSQFCTKQSAERACKLFPQTMESFRPYVDDITKSGKEDTLACIANSEIKASSSHIEWNTLNEYSLSQRRARGLDRGAVSNAKIAEAVRQRYEKFSLANDDSSLGLTSDLLQKLMNLVSGGLSSGGGGGLGGVLETLLGGLGGGGGGGSLGDLSGLLGTLGLSDLLSNGGDIPIDIPGGDNPSPNIPTPTPIPGNNTNPPSDPTPLPSGGNASAEEQAAMDATNRYRQSQGKSVLQIDQQMVDDCRKQAKLQADRGGLTHWLHPAGVARAENIAYGSKSGEYTVMQQWVKSPGHHANIMGNHRYIGVGNFGNQWCQRFR